MGKQNTVTSRCVRLAMLAVLTTTTTAGSAPPPPKPTPTTDTYTVRVKLQNDRGDVTYVPVGEVTRKDGKLVRRGIDAPPLNRLAADLIKRWNAHVWPASVSVSEQLASNTGMRPQFKTHTFAFTKQDALYRPAVIKQFLDEAGYEGLGLRTIRFVIYDSTPPPPPGVLDGARHHSNFRKNPTHNLGGEYDTIFVEAPVRPPSTGPLSDVKRTSASDPTLGIARNHDQGTATIAVFKIYRDGNVTLEPYSAARQFEAHFDRFNDNHVEVSLIENGKWTKRPIPNRSPWLLEGVLISLENREHYDISPAIDPALVW